MAAAQCIARIAAASLGGTDTPNLPIIAGRRCVRISFLLSPGWRAQCGTGNEYRDPFVARWRVYARTERRVHASCAMFGRDAVLIPKLFTRRDDGGVVHQHALDAEPARDVGRRSGQRGEHRESQRLYPKPTRRPASLPSGPHSVSGLPWARPLPPGRGHRGRREHRQASRRPDGDDHRFDRGFIVDRLVDEVCRPAATSIWS